MKPFAKFKIRTIISAALLFSLIFNSLFIIPATASAASSPWSQTNWAGGSGQTSWSDTTKFSSSSNVTTSVANQATLTATSSWYNASWAYRKKITIDQTKVDADLTNFPILVKLTSSNFDFTKALSTGNDLRFTSSDGTTLLSYERVSHDATAQTAEYWVKVPAVSGTVDTDIYMYYGNSAASDGQNATDVWSNSYSAVYHFAETSGNFKNSVNGSTDGIVGGSLSRVDGQIGKGVNSDNGTGYVDISDQEAGLQTEEIMLNVTNADWILHRFLFSANRNDLPLAGLLMISGGNTIARAAMTSGIATKYSPTIDLASSTNYYIASYVDIGQNPGVLGISANGGDWQTYSHAFDWRTDLSSARVLFNQIVGGSSSPLGAFDEFRVSSVIRANAWLKATYNSNVNTLVSYAAEEPQVQTSGTLTSSIFDSGQRSDWGTLTYAATTPTNTSVSVKLRTGNQSDLSDATAFSSCTAISSGSDISSNSCVADTARYIQYQLSLADTDSISTPTFTSFSQAFSLSTPTAPSALSGSAAGTTSITWSWTDNSSDESGFYVQDTSGNTKCTVSAANTTTCTETGLSPNTSYTRKVVAYNGSGNSTASSNASAVTLATAPTTGNITSSPATSSWTNNSSFTFTNSSGFGSGNVEYFRYVWDTSSTHTWIGSETKWTSGTLTQTATSNSNSWYLHLKGYNSSDVENGTLDLGAYYYDATSPNSFDLESPGHNSYTNSERPTLKWKTAVTGDGTSGLSKYVLEIDNPSIGSSQPNGDFTINDIPTSRTTDYETNKYTIRYENFNDSDSTNNYISVYTKSSSGWGSSENDGKLREGRVSWKVKAVDNAGNETSSSRNLYADFTNPVLASVSLNNIGIQDGFLITTSTRPTITGTISDNLMPDKIILSFYKQSFFLGIETSLDLALSETTTLTNSNGATSLTFSLSPSRDIEYGKYQVVVKGVDKAGNNSSEKTLDVQIMTDAQAKTLLTLLNAGDLGKIRETSKISLPDLEKKAILRREKEASEFKKLIQGFSDQINTTANVMKQSFYSILAFARDSSGFALRMTGEGIRNASNFMASINAGITSINGATSQQIQIASSFIGNGLFAITNNIGNLYNNLAQRAPEAIKTTMLAVANGADTVSSAINQANRIALDTFNKSQANLKDEISKTSKETENNLKTQIAKLKAITANAGSRFGGTVQNLNLFIANVITNTNNGFAKSQENIRKQIADAHKKTTEKLIAGGQAIALAWHAIIDPAQKTTGLLTRVIYGVRVGFSTFQAYVFDNNPTKISDVAIEDIGRNFIVISWKTNHYANNNKVNYGTDLKYGQGAWGENWTKDHQVKIIGLKPGQKYFFEVMSQNKNYVYDAYYSFETKK